MSYMVKQNKQRKLLYSYRTNPALFKQVGQTFLSDNNNQKIGTDRDVCFTGWK